MVLMALSSLCWAADPTTSVFYVDAAFQGENQTGESWLSAYSSLQDAIDRASKAGGGEIWVKAGVYNPDAKNRMASFKLRPGVKLYGGFRGTETSREGRNPAGNRAILSGDIGKLGIDSDNSFHILTGCSDALLDGFTFSRGNADGMDSEGTGGGILVLSGSRNFTVANCTFEKNAATWQGGAIFIDDSQLYITNCTFYANGASSGGGIATKGKSALTVLQSLYSSNFARMSGGAVLLAHQTQAAFTNCTFLNNSCQVNGGALSAESKLDFDLSIEIHDCTFTGNFARENAGALYFAGKFSPVVKNCRFARNTSMGGAGVIGIQNGVMAVVSGCSYTKNKGAKNVGNIGNDDTSTVVESMDEVARSKGTEPEAEAVSARTVPDVFVFDSQNTKRAFPELVKAKKLTAIVLGELTDPDFVENYRDIEAIAHDYHSLGVQFYYLYRFLSHPENNGYLQPFNQLERARQVQKAAELLMTKIDWLYDSMDNQTARALAPENTNNVFVFSSDGKELFAGNLSDPAALRVALKNAAGEPDTVTSSSRFHSPLITPLNPSKPRLLDRVHFNPDKEPFLPVQITPMDSQMPYYAKLRVEASKALLRTGDGKLYLGFNVDPLYQMQWNNEGEPLEYEIRAMSPGIVAPSKNTAPLIEAQTTDTEPREFVLSAHQLDLSKPLILRVHYSVFSPSLNKSIDVQQRYLISLKADPCGGEAYRRQIAYKDEPRIKNTVSTDMPFALRQYDSNGDGKLTRSEVSGNLWTKFPDIDTNRDGYLNREEYAEYLKHK